MAVRDQVGEVLSGGDGGLGDLAARTFKSSRAATAAASRASSSVRFATRTPGTSGVVPYHMPFSACFVVTFIVSILPALGQRRGLFALGI